MTNRGLAVNLYQFIQMFGGRDDVENIKNLLLESYKTDKNTREYKNMSFTEYVNAKRSFTADIMGYPQYI